MVFLLCRNAASEVPIAPNVESGDKNINKYLSIKTVNNLIYIDFML